MIRHMQSNLNAMRAPSLVCGRAPLARDAFHGRLFSGRMPVV